MGVVLVVFILMDFVLGLLAERPSFAFNWSSLAFAGKYGPAKQYHRQSPNRPTVSIASTEFHFSFLPYSLSLSSPLLVKTGRGIASSLVSSLFLL